MSAKLWRPREEGGRWTQCRGNYISWRQNAVEKASTQQMEPPGPWLISWGSDKLEKRCGRENQHPERLGPKAPGWAALENGKETLMAMRVRVSMLQFCSVSNSLSHTTLSNKVRGIFFKKTVSPVFIIVSSLWFCMHASAYEHTTWILWR